VVERQLPKLNVVGSIPITRSILLGRNECANARNTFLLLRLRRQMLFGFEVITKTPEVRREGRKTQPDRLNVVGSGGCGSDTEQSQGFHAARVLTEVL
jgi:hypothetical protein